MSRKGVVDLGKDSPRSRSEEDDGGEMDDFIVPDSSERGKTLAESFFQASSDASTFDNPRLSTKR